MSPSSFAARRSLALRLERLPAVTSALGISIGVEAASQIARIATQSTEQAWVARAEHRTVKHLREEVAAALIAVRLSGERDCPPPVTEELRAFQDLERAVVSGRALSPTPTATQSHEATKRGDATTASLRETIAAEPHVSSAAAGAERDPSKRRAWHTMLGSLASWLSAGFQMSAAHPSSCRREIASAGRVTLRFTVSRSTFAW